LRILISKTGWKRTYLSGFVNFIQTISPPCLVQLPVGLPWASHPSQGPLSRGLTSLSWTRSVTLHWSWLAVAVGRSENRHLGFRVIPYGKNHKNPNPGRTHVNCYQFLPLFERENNWFVHVCTSSPLSPKIKLLKFTQRMNVFGI
jgi:hypothetical protein